MTTKLEYNATDYSKFRPRVPQKVMDVVLDFLRAKISSDKWQIAVDVGCGNGQGSNLLAKYFDKVYGFDISDGQIEEANAAKTSDNVVYAVSGAEKLPNIDDQSVQLVTACESAHWFELEQFFAEMNRVVVDNGVVAFIGYWMPQPTDPSKPEDTSLSDFVMNAYNDKRLAPHKNVKIVAIETYYRDMKFPDNYEFVYKNDNTVIHSYPATAQDLIGFIKSWSLFKGLLDDDREAAEQLITEYKDQLKSIVGTDALATKEIIINFQYFIAMGRKLSDD